MSQPLTYAEELATVPVPPGARIETSSVDYAADSQQYEGFLALDAESAERRPGVLVLHEWTGLGESMQVGSEMFARLGYVAFAADVFGTGVRPSDAEAPQVAGRFYGDVALWRERLVAGLAQLQAHPLVDPTKIAAVGYCFGGRGALELAQAAPELRAAVAVHPTLAPIADPAGVKASLLLLLGDSDPLCNDEAVHAFKTSVRGSGIDWQQVTYADAVHAFSILTAQAPERGSAYQQVAARRSWRATVAFLAEVLA